MKRKIILIAALLFSIAISANAENQAMKSDTWRSNLNYVFGIHTGTDFGGAIPLPFRKAIGKDDQMSATLRLKPNIGLSATAIFNPQWSLSLEATYKIVALKAKARVANQTFYDRSDDSFIWVSFRGSTDMEMSFPMLEIPLYVRYSFGKNRVLLGGYYARIFNAKFSASPYKGMLFNVIDGEPDYDNPIGPISPDEPFTQNFDDAMSKWDAGVMLGYERQIFMPKLLVGGRCSMGFKDIFQPDKKYLAYDMKHLRATLMVCYLFYSKS